MRSIRYLPGVLPVYRWLESFVDPFPEPEPGRPPARFWPFIAHYSKPFRGLIVAAAVLSFLVAALEVYIFSAVGKLVDWVVAAESSDGFFAEHGNELLFLGAVVVIVLPVAKFATIAVVNTGMLGNFPMRNRWQGHRYLLRQSMQFFEDDFAGRVATKVMQSALAVRDVVTTFCEVLAYIVVYFVAAVVLFAQADWRLALPMLAWLAGYLLALGYFVPRLAEVSAEQAERRSVVTGRIVDSYTNIATVKMFANRVREDEYARDGMGPFLDNVHVQMRLSADLSTTLNLLNALLIFTVAGTGLALWSVDAITAGAIAFAVGLVMRLQGMAHWIMWEVSRLFENVGVVRDGIETLSQERAVVDISGSDKLDVPHGGIRFDAVTFNYGVPLESGERPIIDALDLDIRPGEKVGVVGRSGAGKSTLVKLLLRLYDVDSGRICIDGSDIARVEQETLRSRIGMVTQDTSLLHRSVLDNILYGRPFATREHAIAAAKRAEAHHFIGDLVDGAGRRGYDAHVGERGVKLSGGQRQRIAIARVLLKDAPIVVLDEATSALDSEVEAAIQSQLQTLTEGKTVLAIAHRLSTIAAMDRLIVMDAGRIVEQGTHASLVASGGIYAELWALQSGGFLAEDCDPQPAVA